MKDDDINFNDMIITIPKAKDLLLSIGQDIRMEIDGVGIGIYTVTSETTDFYFLTSNSK